MKKETFKYLYSFKYNNKEYAYLVSKNYPFYFLEYDPTGNSFDYPDIDTFKELYSKFYSNDSALHFDIKSELEKIKEALCNIDINITPFVKTTSGLVSIVLILVMCGCVKTDDITSTSKPETLVSVSSQDKSQEIYNYFKSYNMEVVDREYDGNDYIFVNDFINDDNKHQITLLNHDEFRKFIGIDFIPTWDDVIGAFEGNKNIDEDKKNTILGAINNLRNREELKGLDLSVLYANAKRMKFRYLSSEEIINNTNRDSAYAYFDTVSGIVYLPSDKPLENFEFIHETLGHGTLAYGEETEDSLISFDCTNYLMLPSDDRYVGYSVGLMVGEGGANLIAHLATNDYSVRTFYELYEEELRVIADLCNISIGQLFNYKGISLYDLMYEKGIDTPVEYIFKMDAIFKGQLYCEFSYLMERLFVDATEEEFINANKGVQDKIINSTVEIIRDTYFKDDEELSFDYPGGSIDYNFEESVERYKENMEQLRGVNK